MRTVCLFCGDVTKCGGTERIAVLLANGLAAQPETKVIFLSLTERSVEPYFALDSRVRRVRMFRRHVPFKLLLPLIVLKLARFLRREQVTHLIDVDVILSAASVFAVPRGGCKHIAWEHFHERENLGCTLRSWARRLAKRCAAAVVVLTEADREQYLVTPSRAEIVLIPDAVPDPDANDGEKPANDGRRSGNDGEKPVNDSSGGTANNGNAPPAPPFILSVGRLDYAKGFERIPALAEAVFRKHPEWKWVIAGEGEYRKRIENEIAARSLSGHVLLPGRVNPYPYYDHAAFLVVTSRFEGFGLALLEALSRGCPAVAFACPLGPGCIVRDGENGFLVPAEDFAGLERRILELMETPSLRAKLAAQAPGSIAEFSSAAFLARWNKLLAAGLSVGGGKVK